MELNFEKGTKDGPVGHALIYFTHINDNSRVSASYVVLLPLKVDISKYIPPFLSGQIETLGKNDMSHFAFPPTPEPVESLDALRKIADIRKDDLINGGNHNLDEVTSMLSLIAEFAEEYVKINPEPTLDAPVVTENTDDVDDVVYSMMSEGDLLSELTMVIGKMRYAVEGDDLPTIEESARKIVSMGKQLPPNRNINSLAIFAKGNGNVNGKLAQLFLDRAYALFKEDYKKVKLIEDEIELYQRKT